MHGNLLKARKNELICKLNFEKTLKQSRVGILIIHSPLHGVWDQMKELDQSLYLLLSSLL